MLYNYILIILNIILTTKYTKTTKTTDRLPDFSKAHMISHFFFFCEI